MTHVLSRYFPFWVPHVFWIPRRLRSSQTQVGTTLVQQISLMDPGDPGDGSETVEMGLVSTKNGENIRRTSLIFLYMFHIGNPYSKEFEGFFLGAGMLKRRRQKKPKEATQGFGVWKTSFGEFLRYQRKQLFRNWNILVHLPFSRNTAVLTSWLVTGIYGHRCGLRDDWDGLDGEIVPGRSVTICNHNKDQNFG